MPTNPSLHVYVHRGSFLASFSSVFFAKIADDRQQQQTTCGEQNATTVRGRTMCACRILSLRRRVAFAIACVTYYCPLAPSFSIGAIYVVFYSESHPTPYVPLLASWRSLTWRSKCDTLLEIIRIVRCFCVLCVISQQQIGRGTRPSRVPKKC